MIKQYLLMAACLFFSTTAFATSPATSKNTKDNDRFVLFSLNNVGYVIRNGDDSVSANSLALRAGIEQWFLPLPSLPNLYVGLQSNIGLSVHGGTYKEQGKYFSFDNSGNSENMFASLMADIYGLVGYRHQKFTALTKIGRTFNSIRNPYNGSFIEKKNNYLNDLGVGVELRWHVRSGGALLLDYQTRYSDNTIFDKKRKISTFGIGYAMPF